jgi:hypothetical protein
VHEDVWVELIGKEVVDAVDDVLEVEGEPFDAPTR